MQYTAFEYSNYLYHYHILHNGNKKQLPTQDEFDIVMSDINKDITMTKEQWFNYYNLRKDTL